HACSWPPPAPSLGCHTPRIRVSGAQDHPIPLTHHTHCLPRLTLQLRTPLTAARRVAPHPVRIGCEPRRPPPRHPAGVPMCPGSAVVPRPHRPTLPHVRRSTAPRRSCSARSTTVRPQYRFLGRCRSARTAFSRG